MSHPVLEIILDGDNCWPDLKKKGDDGMMLRTTSMSVAMLRFGMNSGKTSVAFRFDLTDGRVVFAQTSLDLLEGAVKAFRAKEAMSPKPADA